VVASSKVEVPIDAPLRAAVLGFGHVGQALAKLLVANPELSRRLAVAVVCDRGGTVTPTTAGELDRVLAEKAANGTVARAPPPASLAEFVESLDCDVVVDLLPSDLETGEPSRSIALAALRSGKHVVTANKGLLALHAAEVLAAAAEAGRFVRAGAAVGGGTPILEVLANAFRGDRVQYFTAVLNGSSNFVLCELEQGATWDGALQAARARGILEADPSLDLSGRDAAAKGVIVANALWGGGLKLEDARVRGIWGLDPEEVRDAARRGLAVRLVVRGDPAGGVRVAPVTLPRESPLAVDGVDNAVRFVLEAAGAVTLRGPGAGGRPSAAKVLSDLLGLARP
jgi:homoserine dehydrogenase